MDDIKIGKLVLTWVKHQYENKNFVEEFTVLVKRTKKKDPWEVTLWINQKAYCEKAKSLHPSSIRAALSRARESMQSDLKTLEKTDESLSFLDLSFHRSSIWDFLLASYLA